VGPRAVQILPSPLGPPNHRPWRLSPFLWGRGSQPWPTTHGLGGGGLRGCTGFGGGGVRSPGRFPSQGCLCDTCDPAYWTRDDDAFAQSWGYATAGPLCANPPFSRLEEVVAKAAREGCLILIIAPEWPGPQYPWWAALCALCPKRSVPPRRHGLDASPQVADVGLLAGLTGGGAGADAPAPPLPPPPIPGGTPGHGPGRPTHFGTPPHGHVASRKSAREGGAQAGRAALPPRGATGRRPYHTVGRQTPPFLPGPPHLGPPDTLPAGGRRRKPVRTPQRTRDPPRKVPPHGTPRRLRWQPTRNR